MPSQDGLRFLFDIQDKISAKLTKIEAKAKSSAAKIDKYFTRASRSQETNSARAIASEQRRINAAEKAHAKSIALLKRQSDAFKRSMTRMASAATVAFAAVAGKALSMAGGYDLAMRLVQAKTQASGDLMDRLSEQSREMGRTTVHSATAAARGQAFLAQAGFDANEILEALPATLALATAGELDLASAADITSNVLSGFRLETAQTARVTDVLAKAADSSNTNVAQLGAALVKAAPSAAAAKWSLEEVAAAIGKLSDAGIQGEEAGTALKVMMARLAIDGGPAEKLMAKMGITVKNTTTGAMLPLNDILMELAPHANDVGLQMALLGTRGGNAGLVLGAVAQDAAVLTEELIDATGWAQKNADIMGGGLWGALKKVQSIVESAYISLGERLAPAVKKAADMFGKLSGPVQEVVVAVGSLAGAMGGLMIFMPQAFGSLVQFPGKLIKLGKVLASTTLAQRALNLAMRLNPIGLVITAVAALAAGIYLLWKRYNKLEETFDAAAASTEDLTARYDDLTEKVAAATTEFERAQKGARRFAQAAEKRLRALVAERDEVGLHIQQRAEAAKAAKTLAEAEAKAEKARLKAIERSGKAQEKLAKKKEESAKAVKKHTAHVEAWIQAQIKARKAAEALNDRLEAQRRRLLGLPTKQADQEFRELIITWAKLNAEGKPGEEVLQRFGDALHEAAESGHELDEAQREIIRSTRAAKQQASGYELALASLAGKMGGATGQALNLVIAMREHNKAQKAAALAGKKTEAQFGKMRVGAAGVATGFHALGEVVGGTAGKILGELGNIADAFAKGGIAGAIMAGISAIAKGIAGLFSRGKRKREAARKREMEAFEAQAARMRELAEAQEQYWDSVYSAAINAYDSASASGVKAYDKIFLAALESGAGQEEAIAKATAAQLEASEKILAAEGEKFARIAAFEAALEAVRSGNALGAAEAARQAASDTRIAWETAMEAVAEADKITTATMELSSTELTNHIIADQQRAYDARAAMIARRQAALAPQQGYMDSRFPGMEGYRHGGQVEAGVPIKVGEGGPETFIPSQRGRIEPHGSSGGSSGGGMDAKEFARAVATALEGVKIEVDGRKLGRLTIRHEKLAITELGGRR